MSMYLLCITYVPGVGVLRPGLDCEPNDTPPGYDNGEGNGTPLQYSCLENPMGGGAW